MQWPAFYFSTYKNYKVGKTVASMPIADILVVGVLVVDK